MKAAIVVFPGSNREKDAADALTKVMGHPPLMVWHRDHAMPDVDLILVPGGFSYGDYLRCGAIAAHSPILQDIKAKAAKGVAVLGICNGFQILTEAGLLPGVLLRNQNLKFVCRNVNLRVENSQTLFTSAYEKGQVLNAPVAHHDGNYFVDAKTLRTMEEKGQIAFRYCDSSGSIAANANPNGSIENIAGIFNETKNVLGLMPHLENAIDPLQGSTDGIALFQGLLEALS